MKKCSYCGAEYPDDAIMCAVDHTPLDTAPPPLPGRKHSGMGIASFCISVAVGCFMLALLCMATILSAHRISGDRTHPGQVFVGLVAIFLMTVDVVAVGLGIASLFQTGKNRLLGILGLVFSSATIAGTISLAIIGLLHMRSMAGINETRSNQFDAPTAVLPFQVTTVWPDDESKEMFGRNALAKNLIQATNYMNSTNLPRNSVLQRNITQAVLGN